MKGKVASAGCASVAHTGRTPHSWRRRLRLHPSSFRLYPFLRSSRGAGLVEMALMLPFLLMLLMGVADIGRAFYTYVSLTNGAREGARYASRFPFPGNEPDIALVIARVQDEPNMAGVSWDDVVVEVNWPGYPTSSPPSGSPVTVRATIPYNTLLGGLFGLPPLHVSSKAEMIVFGVDGVTS